MKEYILKYIMEFVPRRLLLLLRSGYNETIEDAVVRRVIYGKVLNDLNMVGGRSITVPCSDLNVIRHDEKGIVLEIPPELREHSNIISVSLLSLDVSRIASSGSYAVSESQLTSFDRITDGMNAIPTVSLHTDLEVLGTSMIYIRDGFIQQIDLLRTRLTFDVEYSSTFNNMDKAYRNDMAKIAKLATEALIYNLRFELNDVERNVPIDDRLLSEIESYDASLQDYDDVLTKLGKISIMTSSHKMDRLVNLGL